MKKLSTPCSTLRSGFTILELAVTVIIIAVIAVVALPMYKHAILKSRFSTVMPMAKAVADAQEVYYLGNNQYALGKEDLDIAPVEAENTQVSLSPAEEDEEYIYVAANRSDVPNARYIMYQKNSPKFASNIHCEALDEDEQATWLCNKALNGTPISTGDVKSLSGNDYTTYLLYGSTSGSTFDKQCGDNTPTSSQACTSGCGMMTRMATCNGRTGEWEWPEYDSTSCPTKPADETATCPNGNGTKIRKAQCKADGSGYEYGAWDESGCCTGTPSAMGSTTVRCSGGNSGSNPICVNGQWQFSEFNKRLTCEYYFGTSATCTSKSIGAANGGDCSGTYIGAGYCYGNSSFGCANSTFTGNQGSRALCFGNKAYSCANSTFTTTDYQGKSSSTPFYNGAACNGNAAYACAGSTFGDPYGSQYYVANRQWHIRVYCNGSVENGCAGTTIKSGAVCVAQVAGGCNNVTYEGTGFCKGSYCPAGAPKGAQDGGGTW